MDLAVLLFCFAAVILAALRGLGVNAGRVDLGWLAIACFFAAVGLLPAATSV